MTDERALTFLRELEHADEAAAAVLDELDELTRAAEDIQKRALELDGFASRLPAKRARARSSVVEAEQEAGLRREALARAEVELAAAERRRGGESLAAARREGVRARDALRVAERKLEAARKDEQRLEDETMAAEQERAVLEARAKELAASLATRPALAEQAGGEPAAGPGGAAEWSSRARAALFVARGRLVAEREGLIRQANELGALVLGEPLTAASAAHVARRVEQARNR